MDHHIVHCTSVRVAALDSSIPCLPNFDRAILRACDHPFPLAVKRNTCDIARVPFEGEDRVWVRRLYIVKLDGMVASCGEEALVGGDTESVYLGIRVLDCARANAGKSLPKPGIPIVSIAM